MPDPRPVALDHNFPEPILRAFIDLGLLPEVEFHWIRELGERLGPDDEGRELPDLNDYELVYELHRIGLSVLVTGDYHMRREPRVLVAVEQTRMTVLTIEASGHDPVRATGALLRDLVPILRAPVPRGAMYNVKPTRPRLDRPRKMLAKLVDDPDGEIRALGLPYAARHMYDEDDPRRLFPGWRRS